MNSFAVASGFRMQLKGNVDRKVTLEVYRLVKLDRTKVI